VSPEIRAYKKLKAGQTGQLVIKVLKTGSAYGKLKVGDVLAAVDGLAISDDGVIVLPGGRRIECGYHFGHKFGGDTLHFSVIRDGKTIELDVPATATDQPADPLLSERPFFYMYAGLVFMPMKRDLVERLCSTGWNERGVRILANSILNEGALIVSRVLPDEITEHCEPAVGECVKAIDGQEVNDLGSIRKAIESGKDPFIVIEFESGTMLVLERAEARAATERIMRRLDMVSNYSFEP
jgi:S1-C subfamily serine protease